MSSSSGADQMKVTFELLNERENLKSEAEKKTHYTPFFLFLFSHILKNHVIALANLATYVVNRVPDQATEITFVVINLGSLL